MLTKDQMLAAITQKIAKTKAIAVSGLADNIWNNPKLLHGAQVIKDTIHKAQDVFANQQPIGLGINTEEAQLSWNKVMQFLGKDAPKTPEEAAKQGMVMVGTKPVDITGISALEDVGKNMARELLFEPLTKLAGEFGTARDFAKAVQSGKAKLSGELLAEFDKHFNVRSTDDIRGALYDFYAQAKEALGHEIGANVLPQTTQVKKVVAAGPKSIQEVAEQTKILEPNVRRILGMGAKQGTFTRLDKGVYTISDAGKDVAYVEAGDALDVLPRLVKEGKKFHSVILDPAYFSRALVGGNRGIKAYDFIHPAQFKTAMEHVAQLVDDNTHVYLMLSGARTAQKDMEQYARAAVDSGFKPVGEGSYTKLFGNGQPVTNVRGDIAAPERLILMSKSGNVRAGEVQTGLDFRFVRPSIAKSYATEKPVELMDALIRRSTLHGETVLDPFAGSGVTGEAARKAGRVPTLIEKEAKVVKEKILPRVGGGSVGYNFVIKKLPVNPAARGALKVTEPYYAVWSDGPLKGRPMGARGATEKELLDHVRALNKQTGQNAILPE